MNEIDQDRKLTDCFFFDGESNDQTAGQVLCAIYPQVMCFNGGFFSATFPNSISCRLVLYYLLFDLLYFSNIF